MSKKVCKDMGFERVIMLSLWGIFVNTVTAAILIWSLGCIATVLETWNDVSMESQAGVDVFVSSENQDRVKTYLKEHNITYEVSIEDIQKVIDEQKSPMNSTRKGRQGQPMSFDAYHSLEDIYTYMDYLASMCLLCEIRTIGTSVEGRPIKVMYYNKNGVLGPVGVIEGGLHGREWASVTSVLYMMRELVESIDRFKDVRLFEDTFFHFIPVANPDGYEYSRKKERLWRKNRRKGTKYEYEESHDYDHNYHHRAHDDDLHDDDYHHHHHRQRKRCDGVDLNRNFGYKWGGAGSSGDQCKETYRGTGPFSEPETKAIADYVDTIASDFAINIMYISLHSYGQKILFPWSYDRINHKLFRFYQKCANDMAKQIKEVQGKIYDTGTFAPTTYPSSGTSMDWAIEGPVKKFQASFTMLLRDTGRFGYLLPAHEILPTGEEALQGLIALYTCGFPTKYD